MRRRRWRTAVLSVGCTSCVLIAVAFVASAYRHVVFQGPLPRGPVVYFMSGSVLLIADQILSAPVVVEPSSYGLSHWNGWGGEPDYYIQVPLFVPFLAVALPTVLVWRLVPKFPRGHCRRCGYNLTGLTEARCPECGAGFGHSAKRRAHHRTSRVRRIFFAHPSNRKDVTAVRLALVVLWHPVVYSIISSPPLDSLWVHASQFWYRMGVSSTYVSSVSGTYYPAQFTVAERLKFVAGLWTTPILIEGFVAWILFSRISRRPRPRFYRFVRSWWRTWLIGTLVLPACAVVTTASPPLPILIPFQAILAMYLLCAPALLARWEWNRRCRRIRPRCTNCGYILTGLPEPRCPECGQPFELKGDAP